MSLFDDPLPPSCHLKSPFGEPPPPLHVRDVLCEWPPSNIFFSHNEIHSLLYVDTGLGKKVYWQKMENTTLGFHIGNIKSL